ncbi:uncharacterized protein LOC113515360 isoform X3 [Galleria mellonella]|uniref:Uncharacterized protein LOC113515360 isoform X3 n=1 Tax=Galleria mellonella TaxID=7137 RepID=A0ABM3MDI2_GALME|nr:uncharacterized protein LOC113515360 isoform X3 [Galleria mellonella]
MAVILLLFVCVFSGIMARPYDINKEKRALVAGQEIQKDATKLVEPESRENLLLPKVFGLYDIITVFLDTRNTKSLNISLIMDDEVNSAASALCIIINEENISIFQNDFKITSSYAHNLRNGSEFIIGFQRIIDKSSQEETGLKIHDFHKNAIFEMELENINKLKYIQFTRRATKK